MKLNIQKRVLPLLCVLALIVACGSAFAVPVGAWNFEEDPSIDYTGQVKLRFQHTMGSILGFTDYSPGQWPLTFTTTDFEPGSYTPFILLDLPFKAGYAVAFVWAMPYAESNSNKVNVQATGLQINTTVTFDPNLNYTVEHGSGGGVFEDDLVCMAVEANAGYALYVLQGTLKRDISSCRFIMDLVDFPSDFAEFDFSDYGVGPCLIYRSETPTVAPSVDSISVSPFSPEPYYPGTSVQMQAEVVGTGVFDNSVTWSVDSGLSGDVTIDENGLLYIPTYEQALSVEVTATSVQNPAISGTYTLDITYPLEGVSIVPGGAEYYPYSTKDRAIQYSLLLPNGDPYEYELIQWIIEPTAGHEEYFSVDDVGMVTIKGGAPVGSGYALRWCYAWDTEKVAPGTAALTIISNDEAILDGGEAGENLGNKGDELDDKNNQLGGAMDELNNAQGALPTLPGDASTLVDVGLLDNSITLMTTILDYEAMGLGDLFPVLGLVAGLAVLLFIIFGKTGG